MRQIIFFRNQSGKSPVENFLHSLTPQQKKKAAFVLALIEELPVVPKEYFKKLKGCDDLWEVGIKSGNNSFRLLGFFDGTELIVLNHAFAKKTQKTPKKEILVAEQRKKEYLRLKQ
ncbi:MAG: type II toxin-antitoxin system RelE/ParE family toxin [Candidatus Electrothrix sp. EH2]|nr:type II toxin-antitoxin system RelE/ParE family toxin [Candidatus Electrothrix sp. EH2]